MRNRLLSFLIVCFAAFSAGCAGVTSSKSSQPSEPSSQSVTVSPGSASVRAGSTQQLTASVTGINSATLTWSVNGVPGGNASVGTISFPGNLAATYTAPAQIPQPNAVTIEAAVTSDSSLNGTSTATLLNPLPQVSSASPSQIKVGAFTVTILGNNFMRGAIVSFGSQALATTFVSASELTATGTATSAQVGAVLIAVTNPNPGSATSSPLNVQVLSSAPDAPKISASPASVNVPTGGTATFTLTVAGSPSPSVSCTTSGGTAQLAGSVVTYTAPNTVPEGGHATVTCTASSTAGSARASAVADVLPSIAGYAGPVPSTFFAMHTILPGHWPAVPFAALGKMSGTMWSNVEQTKGHFNWAILDQFVNEAKARGMGVMYSTAGVPPWAATDRSTCRNTGFVGVDECTSYISNLQDWDDFVTALATRYKGQIQTYELWNEPQNGFTGTMTQMVFLTQHEHDIIRSIDPTATILSPSMVTYGYKYMDSYFASGGTRDVDAVAYHLYPNPNNDIAETVTTSATSTIRAVMSKYGLAGKPLWDTEGGWGYVSSGAITDPNLRAAYVARDYLLHWSMRISRLYWYAWDQPNIGTLWTPGDPPSEPAIAYAQVYRWMNGATMAQPCSINGAASPYHAVYTCDLTRSGNYKARAVWNTDGDSTYDVPSQYVHYRDLQGNVYNVPADRQVTIGLKPILLENR